MKKARVIFHPDYVIGKISDKLFSGYMEPLGNLVYGGIYQPGHPAADEFGLRKDVQEAIKELGIPAVRLPGGNFVSGWEWKDSLGAQEERKKHLDLAWRMYEPNEVGHDEYLTWAERCGMESMYTVNMGTGTIQDAIHLIEYTNHPGGTYWSDLRRKNGFEKPHNVKVWYLGNEPDGPWQIASWEKDPVGYGIAAHEFTKALKWVDPSVKTAMGGASSLYNPTHPEWERKALEQCYEAVDLMSVHFYHQAPEGHFPAFFGAADVFEDFIRTELSVCDYVKGKLRESKEIMLSFDEFGVSFAPQQAVHNGLNGRIPRETYGEFSPANLQRDFREVSADRWPERKKGVRRNAFYGSLGMISIMMVFLHHADRIEIGCNTGCFMQALNITKETVGRPTGYYIYKLLLKYARGLSLQPVVQAEKFDISDYRVEDFHQLRTYTGVPYIQAAACLNESGNEAALFVLNRDWEEDTEIELDARGFEGYHLETHLEMADPNGDAEVVVPTPCPQTVLENGKIHTVLKKLSWNIFVLKKDQP